MRTLQNLEPLQILGLICALFFLTAPFTIPLVANDFWVSIVTEILIWGLFAASVNLLFGYTGLLSFGQAVYFGMGAYGVALGIDIFGLSFWPAALVGIVVATVTAFITGIFAARLTWHYFAIITVVFSLIFFFFAVGWKDVTGGDDGLPHGEQLEHGEKAAGEGLQQPVGEEDAQAGLDHYRLLGHHERGDDDRFQHPYE